MRGSSSARATLLFVPAHMPHRFEDCSPDFATWVLFYGPEGGERTVSGAGLPDAETVLAQLGGWFEDYNT